MWLFALLVGLPLIEIALFIIVGGWLTLWPTLGLVLLSGCLGVVLMRWQGLKVVAELRGDMGQIKNPLSPLAHGALILLAGGLLILPGFFTDILGLLLMVPRLRTLLIGFAGSRIRVHDFAAPPREPRQGSQTIIDGEFYEIGENPPPRGPSGWTRH